MILIYFSHRKQRIGDSDLQHGLKKTDEHHDQRDQAECFGTQQRRLDGENRSTEDLRE